MNVTIETGGAIAAAIRDAMLAVFDDLDIDQPSIVTTITGVGIPLADACDGLAWTRVGTVFPTDGSTAPFTPARPSWDVPAWCIPVEVGCLWGHQNLTEDGSFIDAAEEDRYAERDGRYRLAVITAVAERWRPAPSDPLAGLVMGQRLDAWQPYGPDGAVSGGSLVTWVVASSLAVCE